MIEVLILSDLLEYHNNLTRTLSLDCFLSNKVLPFVHRDKNHDVVKADQSVSKIPNI